MNDARRMGARGIAAHVFAVLLAACATPRGRESLLLATDLTREARFRRACGLMPDAVDRFWAEAMADDTGQQMMRAIGSCDHKWLTEGLSKVELWECEHSIDDQDLAEWGIADAEFGAVQYCAKSDIWSARLNPTLVVLSSSETLVRQVVERAHRGTSSTLLQAADDLEVDSSCDSIVVVNWGKPIDSAGSVLERYAAQVRLGEPPSFRLAVRGTPPRTAAEAVLKVAGGSGMPAVVNDRGLYVAETPCREAGLRVLFTALMCLTVGASPGTPIKLRLPFRDGYDSPAPGPVQER